jgi:IclR family transcriptional regulator, acetate operon repressor
MSLASGAAGKSASEFASDNQADRLPHSESNVGTGVRSAARVLLLVDWLAAQSEPCSLAVASEALALPKSSARLLLKTLVDGGYAMRLPDGTFRMRRLPGEVANTDADRQTVLRVADPLLRAAVRAVHETGFVAVLENSRIVYLNKILPTDREIVYDRNITVGRIPHHVASGLAILSTFGAKEIQAYLREPQCADLVGEEARFLAELARVRRLGYATIRKGRIEGAAGVAAPVFDGSGRTVAAVNISGPSERIRDNLPAIQKAVGKLGKDVSRAMAAALPAARSVDVEA